MSIMIRGMEMPTSCSVCPMLEGDGLDGLCHAASKWLDDDEYWTWYVYPEGDMDDSKPCNCPLVELPPHGRLIESAGLYGKAEDIKTKSLSVCDKPQSWQFGVFWAIEQIEAALTNDPTIIEAEEGE